MLAIIGAMDEEVSKIKECMTDTVIERKAGMDFYCGKLAGKDAVVVRCGIGKVNAGICTQILADDYGIGCQWRNDCRTTIADVQCTDTEIFRWNSVSVWISDSGTGRVSFRRLVSHDG